MQKEVLSRFDVETILETLNREIPKLVIDSISIIETGWDHLVAEINNEWIFRFPRAKQSVANLEREKKLLVYLKQYISLPIPDFHYSGERTAFVGYRKIKGIHLNHEIYRNLTLQTRKHLAKTLASFFTELHQAVSIKQALLWGYGPVIRPLSQIESDLLITLPPPIAIMVREAISEARKDLAQEKNLVFVHQDVNGDNMAFDETAGQVSGIFDFSDTGIAPYSLDFAELFVVDEELARSTANIYAEMRNVPNPLIGGASDYILRKATMMVEGQKTLEKNFLLELHNFLPIWRNLID